MSSITVSANHEQHRISNAQHGQSRRALLRRCRKIQMPFALRVSSHGQDEELEPSPRGEKNRNQRNTKGISRPDSLTLPSQSRLSAKFHERSNDWRYGHRKHDCSTWYGPRCLESKIFRFSTLRRGLLSGTASEKLRDSSGPSHSSTYKSAMGGKKCNGRTTRFSANQ
jgi:hypothetical protein